MKCKRCDQEVTRDEEHYKEVLYDDGSVIEECSGWTCDAVDWRERALTAEAMVSVLQSDIYRAYEAAGAPHDVELYQVVENLKKRTTAVREKLVNEYNKVFDELARLDVSVDQRETKTYCVDKVRAILRAITKLHEEVDQTDPNCPVGVALTKAGLERNPGVY